VTTSPKPPDRDRPVLRQTAVALAFWAAAMALWTGACSDLEGPVGRVMGASVLALCWGCLAHNARLTLAHRTVGIGLGLFTALCLASGVPVVGPWLGGAVFGSALWLLGSRSSALREDGARVLTLTGWHWALVLLFRRSPMGWEGAQFVADAVCALGRTLSPTQVCLGPSQLMLSSAAAMSLPVLLLVVASPARRVRYAAEHFALLAGAIVGVAVVGSLLLQRHTADAPQWSSAPAGLQGSILALWSLLTYWSCTRCQQAEPTQANSPRVRRSSLVLCCLLPVGAILSGWHGERVGGGRVLVYKEREEDWQTPSDGRYGQYAAGRFGLLCEHLLSYGFRADTVHPSQLRTRLPSADAVVLPQLTRRLASDDIAALRDFIARGGGLLYLADHTDVAGCLEPANELLRPYGIAVNFDTALPMVEGWNADLVFADHPAVSGLDNTGGRSGWWVGASLTLDDGATPLIVGRRCWSDQGNRDNVRGGFLGNYQVDPGERVGDLVLAGAARRDLGRVVAFGDTSSIQNVEACVAWRLCKRAVSWVAARPEPRQASWVRGAGLLAIILGAAGLLGLHSRPWLLVSALTVALSAALVPAGARLGPIGPAMGREIVPVCVPGLARVSSLPLAESGLFGCLMAVLRGGGLPRVVEEVDAASLAGAHHVILMPPGEPMSARCRDCLENWVRAGGTLIVSAGTDDWRWLDGWALLRGATVTMRGLGGGKAIDARGLELRACDAYALQTAESQWRPLLTRLGACFAALASRGHGQVYLIADPGFLTTRNLEGGTVTYRANSQWLALLAASGRTP
jgi:hypothetical protein